MACLTKGYSVAAIFCVILYYAFNFVFFHIGDGNIATHREDIMSRTYIAGCKLYLASIFELEVAFFHVNGKAPSGNIKTAGASNGDIKRGNVLIVSDRNAIANIAYGVGTYQIDGVGAIFCKLDAIDNTTASDVDIIKGEGFRCLIVVISAGAIGGWD